jgi:sulfite reductase alpha subunit-like flavoprotein
LVAGVQFTQHSQRSSKEDSLSRQQGGAAAAARDTIAMQQQQQQQQPLVIAYGSETGTAKEVAHYIASRAVRRGLKPWVGALDALPLQLLPSLRASIFVVATTGDGEAPHNMQEAWKVLLRKDLAVNSLADMEFALLALGDSTYAKYCAAARRLDVRLRQLGAKRMIELGYADEQSEEGTWGDVDRWVQGLWAVLEPLSTRLLLGEMNQLSTVHGELEPVQPFKVHAVTREPGTVEGEERFYRVLKPAALVDIDDYVPSMAQVVASRRLTSPDCSQQVQHIELAVEKGYRAGDVAWVHPDNDPVLVGEFAQLLGLSLDEQIEIEKDLVSSSGGGARAQEEEGSLCGLLACHQGDSYGKQSISDLPAVCSIEKLLSRSVYVTCLYL